MMGGGKEDRGFREGGGSLTISGKRRGGQRVIPRAETVVAKVLDGIPSVMILIA